VPSASQPSSLPSSSPARSVRSPTSAGSPQFGKNATTASASGFDLTVSFQEAGLESGAVKTIQVTAHLEATYRCINNGGANPTDPKKTTISSDGRSVNGRRERQPVGSLTLSPPAASSVLGCPNGQTATPTVVTWSNIGIADLSGAFLAIPGTFSFGSPVE